MQIALYPQLQATAIGMLQAPDIGLDIAGVHQAIVLQQVFRLLWAAVACQIIGMRQQTAAGGADAPHQHAGIGQFANP